MPGFRRSARPPGFPLGHGALRRRPWIRRPDRPPQCRGGVCWLRIRRGGPAATDSPAAWAAVPWALGRFTAEFGMGSGVAAPRWPPGHRAGSPDVLPPPRGGGAATAAAAAFGRPAGPELVRAIRTARLSGSPHFHPRPIDVLVWHGPT